MSDRDKVSVNKRSLERMIGKLTYPKFCRHACGDPMVCLLCHAVWEERAMKVRAAIVMILKVACKEQGLAGYPRAAQQVDKEQPKR